jgi:hypothetical protein
MRLHFPSSCRTTVSMNILILALQAQAPSMSSRRLPILVLRRTAIVFGEMATRYLSRPSPRIYRNRSGTALLAMWNVPFASYTTYA